jgi:hypothetical protein
MGTGPESSKRLSQRLPFPFSKIVALRDVGKILRLSAVHKGDKRSFVDYACLANPPRYVPPLA